MGIATNRLIISTRGATEIFQFLEMNTTPRAPNSAGSRLANAGFSTGDSRTGNRYDIRSTPVTSTTLVTSDDAPMASVEMTSPSLVDGSTPACCMAEMAAGTLRLLRLPVTKPR